ncbi:MAG: bacteriohemerythrin [Patescibacteria group bacterium]|nr:bacteriohemerythrin [Patescibacteria group bacterium]
MLIEWKEEYSVNVKELDEQHKKLIEMINRLYIVINNQDKNLKENFSKILKDLKNFKTNHFSTEEKYFHQFNYKNTKEHMAEHKRFGEEVEEFQKKLSNPKENYPQTCFDLLDFLEDWFFSHLTDDDKKYTETFNKNGLF